ncbi:hypothetical protein LOCC1_G003277 [Lachnellula occidentalis]|uniref:Fungal N-terminal domain-containing protein n=1 Tax=Lachnellula occidentalis TaxID=215460 RepID=A0A8H8UH71_9HELO|nr:hypothetical protein LOCC1_G003277 [Lachnellula occidentalis]
MDIVSSAAAVVGLVFNFATAIKTCNDLRSKYKAAARTIESIKHELETTQGALQGTANLMMHDADALASRWDLNKTLPTTFARAIKGFKKTVNDLLDDMEPLKRKDSRLGKMDKVKLLWNEDAMEEHLRQLRAQSSALNLLLTVLQTGTISEVRSNIAKVEAALVQLSVSANDSDELTSARPPEYENHILDDQSDLLDLEWPGNEQNAIPGQRQSIHTDALRTAFASKITTAETEGNYHESLQSTPLSSIKRPIKANLPIVAILEDASAPFESVPDRAIKNNAAGIDTSSYPPIFGASPQGDCAAHRALYDKPIPSNTNFDLGGNSSVENTSSPESPFYNPGPFFNPDVSLDSIKDSELSALSGGSDGLAVGADQMEHVPSEPSPDLIQAVMKANVEEVRRLLDLGHDIESRHPTSCRTALVFVAALGNIELLQMLLARNACVDAKIGKSNRFALRCIRRPLQMCAIALVGWSFYDRLRCLL